MYLVPHIGEIEQVFGGENIYKAEKFPYLSHHNVQLQKCFFDNNVIKTLQKNILQTMTTRIDKIQSTYWSSIFTHIFYESIDQARICLIHDFIEETIYDKCEFLDIQQKMNLMMEITSHLQKLHQNNIAHQQLTPYTIGWIKKNNQLQNLVLYGFGLPVETNLRKPKRSQDEIDYQYRDPLFQYQEAYDFLSSQVCKKNDVWSLGAVFYYLLTQKNLFENSKKNDENILNPFIIDQILQIQKPGNKILALGGLQKLKNLLKDMLSTNKDMRPNIDQVQRQLREIHGLGYINRVAQLAFPSPIKENQNLPQPPAFPIPNQTLPAFPTPTKQGPFSPTPTKQDPPAHPVPPQQAPLPFPMNQQQPNYFQQPNLNYVQSLKTPQETFQVLAGHHYYQTAPQTQQQQQFNNPNQANQAQAAAQQQSLIFIRQQAAPTAQQPFQNQQQPLNGQFQNQFQPFNGTGLSTPKKEQ